MDLPRNVCRTKEEFAAKVEQTAGHCACCLAHPGVIMMLTFPLTCWTNAWRCPFPWDTFSQMERCRYPPRQACQTLTFAPKLDLYKSKCHPELAHKLGLLETCSYSDAPSWLWYCMREINVKQEHIIIVTKMLILLLLFWCPGALLHAQCLSYLGQCDFFAVKELSAVPWWWCDLF